MKYFHMAMILQLISYTFIYPQVKEIPIQKKGEIFSERYRNDAIPGSHLLWELEQNIRRYLQAHPESIPNRHLPKGTAWSFQVGHTKAWWATNFITESEYQVQSTCRAVGEHCYIFVEDSLWEEGGSGRVTQQAVESIIEAFDHMTPANPNIGIYQTVVDNFGEPPDVDSDPKIIILILNIIDGYNDTGGYVGGYFYSANEFEDGDPALGGHRSNHAEIYYVDGNPVELATAAGIENAMFITAHEFQHMIHWWHDSNEEIFVNEGCSEISSVICGYPLRPQSYYANETNEYLFQWRKDDNVKVLNDYSRAARWTLYQHEQFPNGYLKELVSSPQNGYWGINEALASYSPSTPRRFFDVFEDWLLANYINDETVDPKYAYTYEPIVKVIPTRAHIDPNVTARTDTIKMLGAEYIKFSNSTNLSITFNSSSPSLTIKAIKIGSIVIDDVPRNTPYNVPDLGTTYSEVTFVLINRSTLYDAIVTYSSSGIVQSTSLEVTYDDGQPEGYLSLSEGDTIAVYFDGTQETWLDSIRIAFRRQGSIQMGVNRYTGTIRPTPLGQRLLTPFNVICNSQVTSVPYPIPYDNWVTVDLSQQNINTGSDFIVWFNVGVNPLAPGVMISSEPDDGDYHSYTYLGENSNWYVLNDGEGNNYNYVVHAYLTLTQTEVQDMVPVSPGRYVLSQNYPNPFNPNTEFRYNLPRDSEVSIRIYDVLGRVIRNLVEAYQQLGNYMVSWDGLDDHGRMTSSGIYFIRMEAGNFEKVRKITLMR